jgi:undecaprenyl-diphosphatase
MDPIMQLAFSLDAPLLTSLSVFVSNYRMFMVILVLLFFAIASVFRELDATRFLAITAAFALLISLGAKPLLAQARPCPQIDSKVPCPADFGTPSGHAIIAFAFALALHERKSFPIFIAIALLVSFSRMYLGVHSFIQIAASLALAFVALASARLADKYSRRIK